MFPNGKGILENHGNIIERILCPVQVAASVVNDKGTAKYTGTPVLRHFYASWCINRKKDRGPELPMKTVQGRLGHASIVTASDVHGHLFPRGDDGSEIAEAERLLLA